MLQRSWKPVLMGAVVVGVLAVITGDARAFWWRACRPATTWTSCYTPCYSYYTPAYSYTYSPSCYDPCATTTCGYYVGYRPGPLRRLLFGPSRWYYGCWSAPACGYTVSYSDPAVIYEEPATSETPQQPTPARKPAISEPPSPQTTERPGPPGSRQPGQDQEEEDFSPTLDLPSEREPPTPETEPPAEPAGESSGPRQDGSLDVGPFGSGTPTGRRTPTSRASALVTVWVPHDAKVTVNGYETKSQGSRRRFVSYGLKPGFEYEYEIRARVPREGKMIEDVQTVTLTAGSEDSVAFGFNRLPTQSLAAGY
ncbi:MAG: TIGR03000 domain-containing protein [Pirellulales bacterium]